MQLADKFVDSKGLIAIHVQPRARNLKKLPKDFSGKKVTVFGLGISGQSAALLAAALGAEITVLDHRPQKDFSSALLEKLNQWDFHVFFGSFPSSALYNCDLMIVSPGVSPEIPELIPLKKRGIPMISELEFSSNMVKAPIVAVTGTNGKSTTTTLIGHIFAKAGRKVFVGGNLGDPLSRFVLETLKNEISHDGIILEVSSFQLELIDKFCPKVAIILNIQPDHQDRYEYFEDYVEAKGKIFQNMGPEHTLILNKNDPHCMELMPKAKEKGIKIELFSNDQTSFLDLPGKHNQENMHAAILAAQAFGISIEDIKGASKSYSPLKHRLENLDKISEVSFYNDSKATNVHAAQAALESFDGNLLWIAGGMMGEEKFFSLKDVVSKKVRYAFFIGESKNVLAKTFSGDCPIRPCDSLGEAIALAFAHATPEDIVLFSPACKSYDRYKNFEERGEHFRRLVEFLSQSNADKKPK